MPSSIRLHRHLHIRCGRICDPSRPIPCTRLLGRRARPIVHGLRRHNIGYTVTDSSCHRLVSRLIKVTNVTSILSCAVDNRRYDTFGPSPRVCLHTVRTLKIRPTRYLIVRSSPLNVRTNGHSNTHILTLHPRRNIGLSRSQTSIIVSGLASVLTTL